MSKYCPNCGAWQEDSAKFCENCGNRLELHAEPEAVEVIIEPPRRNHHSPAVDAREVRERLVGTKTEYYLPRFEKMETLNSFVSWNWCACLFGCSWMLYRKMYVYGILLWIVMQAVTVSGVAGLSLIAWIGAGVLGNFLYMKDINSRTEKAMNMQPEEREAYIQQNSGTSWKPVVIGFLASMAVAWLFM